MNGTQVLVVDLVKSRLLSMKALLEGAGFTVHACGSFSEARQSLDRATPDLLLTQLRLGAYNGLHLVIQGRLQSPRMRAIVTGRERDVGLETEARRSGAVFMPWPVADAELLAAVRSSLDLDPKEDQLRPLHLSQP